MSDVLLLELLQDIPPEWGVTYAGRLCGCAGGAPCAYQIERMMIHSLFILACKVSSRDRGTPHQLPSASIYHTGWDASYLESNFIFVDISHPMADVESLALGA